MRFRFAIILMPACLILPGCHGPGTSQSKDQSGAGATPGYYNGDPQFPKSGGNGNGNHSVIWIEPFGSPHPHHH
jgi:hypothetical protein